jgi:Cdc6-like AAA superfamily ATPase
MDEPHCILLLGPTGMGKTTICLSVLNLENDRPGKTQSNRQILYTSVPKSAASNSVSGAKSLAKDLLRTLGEEIAFTGRGNYQLDDWTHLLVTQLRNCGVRLIILDEFHHLVQGNKVVEFTAEWVKQLVNKTKIPLVLCGLDKCSLILDVNPELQSRFTEYPIRPWDYAVDEDRAKLRKFLKALDYRAPLEEWSNLSSDTNVYRFYQATSGLIRYIIKLYRFAVENAIHRGDTAVRDTDLSLAYTRVIPGRRTDFPNPFDSASKSRPPVRPGSLAEPVGASCATGSVDLRKGSRR